MSEKCPNCGSYDFSQLLTPMFGTSAWMCRDCHYRESIGNHDKRIKAISTKNKLNDLKIRLDELINKVTDVETKKLLLEIQVIINGI